MHGEHMAKGAALVEHAIHWHETAQQDTSPVLAARHADFAISYLNAAREILPDRALEQAARVDVHALHETLDTAQRAHAAAFNK